MARPGIGGHAELDELKLRISLAVLARHSLAEVRRRSLDNLVRWKLSGVWCPAYDEWRAILERRGDEALFGAMTRADDQGNRLRQSLPYVGMLPADALKLLREEVRT